MSDRRQRRFRMHLRSGKIINLDAPAVAKADDEDRWRPTCTATSRTAASTRRESWARTSYSPAPVPTAAGVPDGRSAAPYGVDVESIFRIPLARDRE